MSGSNKQIAKLGDIITIAGYGSLKFRIFATSYSVETNAYESFEDVYYDVVALISGEYLIADHHDITIVESPKPVNYGMLKRHQDGSEARMQDIMASLGMGKDVKKTEEYDDVFDIGAVTVDISMYEAVNDDDSEIDKKLDEINDWLALIDMFGEDVHYRENIERLEGELKSIVEGGE